MAQCNQNNVNKMLDFVFKAPYEEEIVNMDCNDFCEELAQLADKVANGACLDDLLPALQEHMRHWKDCCEEFDALVAILRAEQQALPLDLDHLDKPT